MPGRRSTTLSRRARFIDQGGDAFLPQSRMREIRWEEAVIRSRLRREGMTGITFRHVRFPCPQGCCLGTAFPQVPNPAPDAPPMPGPKRGA